MRDGIKRYFTKILKKMSVLKLSLVMLFLDIGANDGTLLKYFKKDKIITIGCEPANNLKNELKKKL